MKKVLMTIAAAMCAALVFSCTENEQPVNLPTATLAADEAFVGGKANLTVTLSVPAPVDVTATLAYGQPREGKTAIEVSALKFDEKVTLKAGEKNVSCTVELVSTENIPDGAEAPIAIANVSAGDYGTLQCDVNIAYISYKAADNDEYGPENPNNPGDNPEDKPTEPTEEGLTLRTDWTATVIGEPYTYDNYAYFDVNPTVPGIKYFWMDTYTQDELQEYYEGSVKAMLEDYSASIKEELSGGSSIAELLFSTADEEFYVQYWGAGATTLYILEFDASGNPTYNYGKVDLVLPEIEGNDPGDDPGDEEEEIYDVIGVNGTGDNLFYFDIFAPGEITDQNLEDNIYEVGSVPAWTAYEINSYFGAMWLTAADVANDAEYNTASFDELELGKYDVLIVGITEDGDITGEYNISSIQVDGHEYVEEMVEIQAHNAKVAQYLKTIGKTHQTRKAALTAKNLKHGLGRRTAKTVKPRITPAEMVLQPDWTVEVVGEAYYASGDEVVDVKVNLPGIKYYFIEENTKEDLDYYYDGDVSGIANSYEEQLAELLDGSTTMADILYSGNDPQPFIVVYNEGAETTAYVIEFDENGKATGRYGASTITMPEGAPMEEPDVQILGPITRNSAWQAEYLGRMVETSSGDDMLFAPRKKSFRVHVRK